MALGIIGRPELLFLDEPTTGFDPEARREFWELIRDLAAAGTTIVLTTHYLDEAEALADRVGVIAGGRLVEVAPPNQLGNRQEALATVSWRTPDGTRETAQSATPTALVAELAARFGGEVPGLTVTRPTLEDIYLQHDRTPMTTTTKPAAAGRRPGSRRTGPGALALRQGRLEITQFLRSRESVVFTMGFPIIMILIFASIFDGDDRRRGQVTPSTSSPA